MEVKLCMTTKVDLLTPENTLAEAAKLMCDDDVGSLLIQENDRLVGVITDRDIVIRACSKGLDMSSPISEAMSPRILYCFEDEEAEDVAENMGKNQVHRLPVLNHEKKLVGIVSLGDLSMKGAALSAGEALSDICQPAFH